MYFLFLSIGLVLLFAGLRRLKKNLAFIRNGKVTRALVFKIEESYGPNGALQYIPFLKFITDDNTEIIYEHFATSGIQTGSNKVAQPKWFLDQEVKVVYDPLYLGDVKLLRFSSLFLIDVILLATASPFLTVSLGYYFAGLFIKGL